MMTVLDRMSAQRCAACYQPRPLEELLVVWERRRPWRRRWICRPAAQHGDTCFRLAVGPASIYAIGPASPSNRDDGGHHGRVVVSVDSPSERAAPGVDHRLRSNQTLKKEVPR